MSTARSTLFLPPPEWRAHCRAQDMSIPAMETLWAEMTRDQRRSWIRRQTKIANARARVEAGTASIRETLYAQRGGHQRHATDEERKSAKQAAIRSRDLRRSSSALAFKKSTAVGCVVDECPLHEEVDTSSAPWITLLEYDHRDASEKVAMVSLLHGVEREIEHAKTDTKCLWHHHLHTRHSGDWKIASKLPRKFQRQIAAIKESKGCEHPVHKTMEYAALVPSSNDDPLVHGFLHVSHIRLDVKEVVRPSYSVKLDHLNAGSAVIHCAFCHRLWTACEHAKIFDTPVSRHHFDLLLKRSPAFVQHFEESTVGIDWSEVKRRRGAHAL